jgi:hypothetical protein
MRKGKIKNIARPEDDLDRSLPRPSPRFCALRVRRPPQFRGRPVEQPGGGAQGSPDVGDLGPLGGASVGVHGGHLRSVAAVLAEPAEARRVQDARAHSRCNVPCRTIRFSTSCSFMPADASRAACHSSNSATVRLLQATKRSPCSARRSHSLA